MLSLKNKIAVVTGGGSGIGRAISTLFARQGAMVHIIELSENAAKDALEQIYTEGGNAVVHPCNVAIQNDVKAVFERIGNIHILVNNAGVAHIGNVENTSEADFDRVFSVNVKGVYNCLQAAMPQFRGGGGVIGEQANLGLGRTGIGFNFLQAVLLEDALLNFGGEFHRLIGIIPSWI